MGARQVRIVVFAHPSGGLYGTAMRVPSAKIPLLFSPLPPSPSQRLPQARHGSTKSSTTAIGMTPAK